METSYKPGWICPVPNNFSGYLPQGPDFSGLVAYRQEIYTMEYGLDTNSPGDFTNEILWDFVETINDTIKAIRESNNQLGSNEQPVQEYLRAARRHLQLAADEILAGRRKARCYQYIETARENLQSALLIW